MRGIIDRLEDGVAVILVEDGGRIYLPATDLPPDSRPGTLIRVTLEREGEADPGEVAAFIAHLRHGGHL